MVTGQRHLKAKLSANTASFQRSIGGVIASTRGLQTALIGVGSVIAAGKFLEAGAREAAAFEEEMVEVAKVTDDFTASILATDIEDMAVATGTAAAELTNMAAAAGRFGIRGTDQIKEFIDTTNQMVIATDLTADEAGKAFAKLSTVMDQPISEIGRMGSAINALSNQFAVSSSEMTNTMLRSATTLRQDLGLTRKEVLGLSAAMNEVTPTSRLAAQNLKFLGRSLSDPRQVKGFAQALDLNVEAFRKMVKNAPLKTMNLLAKVLNTNEERARTMREEINSRTIRALNRLFKVSGRVAVGMEVADQELKGLNNSLEKETTRALSTTQRSWSKFWESVDQFQRSYGRGVNRMIKKTGLLEGATKFMRQLAENFGDPLDILPPGEQERIEQFLEELQITFDRSEQIRNRGAMLEGFGIPGDFLDTESFILDELGQGMKKQLAEVLRDVPSEALSDFVDLFKRFAKQEKFLAGEIGAEGVVQAARRARDLAVKELKEIPEEVAKNTGKATEKSTGDAVSKIEEMLKKLRDNAGGFGSDAGKEFGAEFGESSIDTIKKLWEEGGQLGQIMADQMLDNFVDDFTDIGFGPQLLEGELFGFDNLMREMTEGGEEREKLIEQWHKNLQAMNRVQEVQRKIRDLRSPDVPLPVGPDERVDAVPSPTRGASVPKFVMGPNGQLIPFDRVFDQQEARGLIGIDTAPPRENALGLTPEELAAEADEMDRLEDNLQQFVTTLSRPLENTVFRTMTDDINSVSDAVDNLLLGLAQTAQSELSRVIAANIAGGISAGAGNIGQSLANFFYKDTPGPVQVQESGLLGFAKNDKVVASQTMEGLRGQIGDATGGKQIHIEQNITISPETKETVRAQVQNSLPQFKRETKETVFEAIRRGEGPGGVGF